MITAPSAGRGSERQHSTDPYHRPTTANSFRSPKAGVSSRNSTPSISPLSNASGPKENGKHPASNSDQKANVEDPTQDISAPSPAHSDAERSSSLSEFDGSLDEQDKLDLDETPRAVVAEENESEADTEILERTPQKLWKHGETGRTPSKLSQQANLDEDLSEAESTPTARGPSASPTSGRQATEYAGRKRKRTSPLSEAESSLSEESDSDQALSKRRTSQRSGRPLAWDPAGQASTAQIAEAVEAADVEDQEVEAAAIASPALSPTKGDKKRRGRTRRRETKETTPEIKRYESKAEQDNEEAGEPVEEDEEESTEALSAEEVERRKQAEQSFIKLQQQFKSLRKAIHAERLASAEAELVALSSDFPSHPDYLAQLQVITLRRDTKIQQEMNLYQYKKGALRTETVGTRAQLHSQYFQEAREIREGVLYDLGKQWYDIQKDRRAAQADELDQFTTPFPTKRSEQIRQQAKYNMEVSVLSGVAKHVGFPAAPEIEGARQRETDDDFKAMKITRKQPYTFPYASAEYRNYVQAAQMPTAAGLAEKEFLEQTPWANPHHPVHQQSRTPSAFRPQPLGLQSSGPPTGIPFTTPLPGTHRNDHPPGSNETVGVTSDPPSSTMIAPPTMDRIQLIPHDREMADGSPTGAYMKRMPGQKRDFSGLSSTSTIDAPADSGHMGDHAMPALPVEHSAVNQAFVTSALHAQNGDERRPELYNSLDFRRAGAFGTPKPLGHGHSHGHGMPGSHASNRGISADAA